MTFKLRVFVLVALVALVAMGVSTYLTLRFAENQVASSTQSQQQTLRELADRITKYGRDHGTWERVADLARQLAQQNGKRIRLETQETRVVIVDTALLLGQPNDPVTEMTASVDPRPQFELNRAEWVKGRSAVLQAMELYRQEIRFAACLTRNSVDPVAVSLQGGVPTFSYFDAAPTVVQDCRQGLVSMPRVLDDDRIEIQQCELATYPTDPAKGTRTESAAVLAEQTCLQEAYLTRISGTGPEPLQLAVAVEETTISATPVALAVSAVAVPIILCTLLLSRHVLRPIRELTLAARRFGQGALDQRVAVAGGGELARLAQDFNNMADSLQRSEEQQRRMIADVAHELRTPLSNLRAYLEALEDGLVTPDAALFHSLHEEVLLQQRIVDDLQTLALAEAGRLRYHWSTVSLSELLESCRTAHQPSASTAAVELKVTAEPGVFVRADAYRLRQALGNLVTNAVRHSPAGSTVTLSAARSGPSAVLAVTDRGSGIAAADRAHVFDRFWRADRARSRTSGGSGLGLAITRQIVLDHQGDITLISELAQGTTFTIRLPALDSPE
ncbi:HAMP domain-containing sensor histidine kinase [Catellatospora sp. KI3]|uniref:sensor histidine kinase n=1 Tax=Catellatospora sp. KI3 TaxID=3041620 RepID=UPI002482F60E|nr:HAMP domain-containing sensor histidine kinase [Catellatospora sp. KI3]MDI1465014.1 HAMP domain-containing sensor histidine kinase [Catellatospora sp. KI3]